MFIQNKHNKNKLEYSQSPKFLIDLKILILTLSRIKCFYFYLFIFNFSVEHFLTLKILLGKVG